MTSSLSKLKVTPSFCNAFKIPDNPTASTIYMQSYKAQQTMLLCLFFHFFYHLYKMQIITLIDRQLKRDVQKQSWSQLLANNWTYKLHDQQQVIENTIELQQSCIKLLLFFSFLVVFRFQIHLWVVIRSQAFRRNFQTFDKFKVRPF